MDFRELKKLKNKKDNRGLTLVEVVCAVAIFSLIAATVGGILVFTSRTYRNGSTETAVQQEAQFAANRIGDIVKDSILAEFSGETNATGSYGTLVLSNGSNKYTISLADGSTQLMYREEPVDPADPADPTDPKTGILADNIVSFTADTSRFPETKTLRLDMTVEEDGREYVMSYNMTARNDDVTLEAVPAVRTAAIIVESRIILEPGQTDYEIPVNVVGSSQGIEVVSADDTQVHASCTLDNNLKISVEATAGETNSVVNVNIATKEKDADSVNPLATTTIAIQIRRVDELAVTSTLVSGDDGKTGAQYKFVSSVTRYTPYLARKVTAAWDVNYKNPYAVQWNYENNFTISGIVVDFDDYFEVVEKQENIDTPYLILKLKKNLAPNSMLTVEGVSKHAAIDGGNKCGTAYNTGVKASVSMEGPEFGGSEAVVLEPGEHYQSILPVEDCVYTTTPSLSTLSSKGTTVSFVSGQFDITLGKDEVGDSNGKIKVEFRPAGDPDPDNVQTIDISVRRIDGITLECKQLTEGDEHPVKEPLLKGADYQFYADLEGTNLGKTSEENEAEYLPNPYAVEFSWEFRIKGTQITGLPGISGSVIWEQYGYKEKTGNETLVYDHVATNPGNKYFKLVDLGTNSEHPYINFMLTKDFPLNAELIVTARALHPAGSDADGTARNQTGEAYIVGDVVATVVLEGVKTHELIDPDDPFDDREVDFLDNILCGQDFENFPDNHEVSNYYDSRVWKEGKWYLRVREILGEDDDGNMLYGPWTTYRRALVEDTTKRLMADETRSFLVDKRYQLEMAFMAIDQYSQTIHWPYDTSLTAAGSGTGFEGYTNDWNVSTQFTSKDAYSSTYNIGRAGIIFEKDGTTYKSYGTVEAPHIIDGDNEIKLGVKGTTINFVHHQHKCQVRVQKLRGNTWVSVDTGKWNIDLSQTEIKIGVGGDKPEEGVYRVSIQLKNSNDWTYWSGTSMFNSSYTRYPSSDGLLCGSNGTVGYIYVEIE